MSGETMHTPGPWETDPEFEHQTVLGPDGFVVADCAIFGFGEIAEARHEDVCRANARLVAAAPDLLAALTALDQVLDLDPDEESVAAFAKQLGIENPSSLADAIALTRAALALATGGRENG